MIRRYSTAQAAKKLGLSLMSIHRYMKARKISVPPMQRVGNVRVRLWSDKDIERLRALLPKIANGRKTRHQQNARSKHPERRGPNLNKRAAPGVIRTERALTVSPQ